MYTDNVQTNKRDIKLLRFKAYKQKSYIHSMLEYTQVVNDVRYIYTYIKDQSVVNSSL